MRIEIDTKEDLHNLRHVIQFLHSISANAGKKSYYDDSSSSSSSMFSDSSSSSQQTPPATGGSLFNMFDSAPSTVSSTPSSAPSSSTDGFMSLFSSPEPKKDEDKGDFIDQLQVY